MSDFFEEIRNAIEAQSGRLSKYTVSTYMGHISGRLCRFYEGAGQRRGHDIPITCGPAQLCQHFAEVWQD